MPSVWLIAMVAGFPILSETMYTPALPNIANNLNVPSAWIEYTLSIYFVGTALGTILWGRLSDQYGRRPILFGGFLTYIVGCLLCFLSTSITSLFVGRIVQSLGASVGVVLGQTMAHDLYRGRQRGQAFSTIGSILSLAPAIGPLIGGFVDQYISWQAIFLVLMMCGVMVAFIAFFHLPETLDKERRGKAMVRQLVLSMAKDPKIIICGITVGISNGLVFSYNAEGPFYLINMLGLTPMTYGAGLAGFALAGSLGNRYSKYLHNFYESSTILRMGQVIIFSGSLIFAVLVSLLYFYDGSRMSYVILTFFCMLIVAFGRGLTIANCLSLALEGYSKVSGTAASFFVCFYYTIISSVTTGMGLLHNGTLFPMPFYFCALGLFLMIVRFFVPSLSSHIKS
ncbi:multidrug effflux MFS transporter [Candidatus Hepatobacter penaei]|uniref:multidrug effflux MFS transporter n=1 Tax=Candidatus Hepatobacter penaei TaxID=1274402 RepID=UPI0004F3484E|nr:multidrug effflux MFS transporter [Candidatus Hepatobacter penaei]